MNDDSWVVELKQVAGVLNKHGYMNSKPWKVTLRDEMAAVVNGIGEHLSMDDAIEAAERLEKANPPEVYDATAGVELIRRERLRQIEVLGYDAEHDTQCKVQEYIDMAVVYMTGTHPFGPVMCRYKPDDTLKRRLEKAGALVAAAIDRLNAIEADSEARKASR